MRAILSELRDAARDIASRPAWSALVVAVLAAGLGSVLYVVTLLDGLVLRPLPFEQPQQLHMAGIADGDDLDSVPQVDAADIIGRIGDAASVSTWSDGTVNLVDGERARRHDGVFAGPALFEVLRVQPLLGRGFAAEDLQSQAPLKVAIGEDLWRNEFGADPGVIGRAVRANGEQATIVAVMPAGFSFPRNADVWLPDRRSATPQRHDDRPVQLVLRVQDAAQLPRVEAAIGAWLEQARIEEPEAFRDDRPRLMPARDYFVDAGTRAVLGVMLAATVLVLLVACGNAANLMLARQLGRRHELAVRSALGASRGRLAGGMFVHALLLSLLAAALALVLAQAAVGWTLDAFTRVGEEGPPAWMRFGIDGRVVLAAAIAALGTAAASALAPALRVTSALSRVLGEGGRGAVGGLLARLGGALVTLEVALSAVLLIGALAMVQLVQELASFDLGVRTERVLTARLGLFDSQYPDPAARLRLFERLTEALRAEPEVEAATLSTTVPGLMGLNEDLLPADAPPSDTPFEVGYIAIDPHFGATWGTRLLEGRWIDARDHADAERVAVVDRKFVERHAGGRPVVGQRFRVSPGESGDRVVTVVGVVEALTIEDADDPPEGVLLVPLAQDTPAFASLALRLRGDPGAFKPRLAEVMRGLDPDTPLYWVRTWDEVELVANFGQHLLARIYAVLGLVGLLLAVGGLYGVVGAQVAERTREIGVRRALGATPRGVLASVLGRSAGYTGAGLALGLALGVPFALALSRSLQGTMAVDPAIWLLVTLLLGATAAVASLIPARRALRVDPMVALRHE